MANAKHTTVVESTFFLAVWSTKACEHSRFSLLLAAKHWQNVPGGEELEETTVFAGFGQPVIHRSPGAHFSSVGQGRDLALGQRHCTRILVLVLGKRVCSHQCLASSVLWHRARIPGVNSSHISYRVYNYFSWHRLHQGAQTCDLL